MKGRLFSCSYFSCYFFSYYICRNKKDEILDAILHSRLPQSGGAPADMGQDFSVIGANLSREL